MPESAKRPRIPPTTANNKNKKKGNKSTQGGDDDDNVDPQEDATLEFKTPSEAETLFVIRNPSAEQAAMLRKMAEENSMELEEMKVALLVHRAYRIMTPLGIDSCTMVFQYTEMQENTWARLRDLHPGARAIHAT